MSTTSIDEQSIQRTLENLAQDYAVVITGQSFSGKGTLAENMIKACPAAYRPKEFISTGQLFRDSKDGFAPSIRQRIEEINDAGKLQDSAIAASLVINKLMHTWEQNKLLILEGSPRSVREARILYPFIRQFLGKKIFLIHLTIGDALARERALGRNAQEATQGGQVRTDTKTETAVTAKLAYYREHVIHGIDEMERQEGVCSMALEVVRGMSPLDVFMKVMDRAPIFQTVH